MLVYDMACRSEQTFPPTLPGLIRKINIFDIERMVKRIQAAYRAIFLPVNRAGTAAGPQNRNGLTSLVEGSEFVVPEFKESPLETTACFTRFFAAAGCVGEKNL